MLKVLDPEGSQGLSRRLVALLLVHGVELPDRVGPRHLWRWSIAQKICIRHPTRFFVTIYGETTRRELDIKGPI